jgi:hypothetical protein
MAGAFPVLQGAQALREDRGWWPDAHAGGGGRVRRPAGRRGGEDQRLLPGPGGVRHLPPPAAGGGHARGGVQRGERAARGRGHLRAPGGRQFPRRDCVAPQLQQRQLHRSYINQSQERLDFGDVFLTDFIPVCVIFFKKKICRAGTGAGLLLPGIAALQEKAFFKTETVSQMVRGCEAMLEAAVPAAALEGARRDREALALAEQSTFRNTVAALLIMQDVRAASPPRPLRPHSKVSPCLGRRHPRVLRASGGPSPSPSALASRTMIPVAS